MSSVNSHITKPTHTYSKCFVVLCFEGFNDMDSMGKVKPQSMVICEMIWENIHSSHIWFCSFGNLCIKTQGMVYRFETLRDDKAIVILLSLKVLHLSVILDRFYELPQLKN